MPQIQTIEGLFPLGQVSSPQTQSFQMATRVSKDAYIATVKRILEAAEESPDHKVTVPAFPRGTGSNTPCTVQGEFLVCRMTQMMLSEIVAAFREGPDPQYFDPARLRETTQAQFDQDSQAKAIFPILVSIEQQLPVSRAVWWALGLGAVAVLGFGWYMTSRKSRSPRRTLSLRGLEGTPSEHVKKAKEYAWTAEMLMNQNDLVGALEKASQAISECSWTGVDWPNECVKANLLFDATRDLLRSRR